MKYEQFGCVLLCFDYRIVYHGFAWFIHTYYLGLLQWQWKNHLIDPVNTLRPRQVGRHFADDSFTCIFFNENCCILIKFSLKYVRKGPIDNNQALVQIMTWRRSGDKPLSEPMMISLPTHICVTRPQWVKLQWRIRRKSTTDYNKTQQTTKFACIFLGM